MNSPKNCPLTSRLALTVSSLPGGHTVDRHGWVHGGSDDFSFLAFAGLLGLLALAFVVWLVIAKIFHKLGADEPGWASLLSMVALLCFFMYWQTHNAVIMILGVFFAVGFKATWR